MDTRMQKEGSQYGLAPGTASYSRAVSQVHAPDQSQQQQLLQQKSGDAAAALAEAASPISSRPPAAGGANFVELTPGAGGIPEDDVFAAEDSERGTTAGNRWPQQETLALLRIRSEMDAAFKEASLKGPLWEDVSRNLAELGYSRSAKKCKEKFENVQKYYKRTKEGRAGRQDGKNYRFFSELEALHSGSGAANTSTTVTATPAVPISVSMVGNIPMVGSSSGQIHPTPISIHAVSTSKRPDSAPATAPAGVSGSGAAAATGVSFASDTSFSSESEDDELEEGLKTDAPKRQRTELVSKKVMSFFERLMKEVAEKQERMLESFLETIDNREQERRIREEAGRRQEMARLNREQEIMAQERAISASRDSALIAFLQKFTGQTIQIVTIPAAVPPPQQKPSPPQSYPPRPPQPRPQQQRQNQPPISTEIVPNQRQSSELVLVQQEQPEITGGRFDSTSSRWPKAEVLTLIKLRSDLELKYQEAGPKGPLWEEISKQMQQLGHKRSAKRCKEKWENINKYFKKVKESKKKRPKDAKTCPYFHELDALYHKKLLKSGVDGAPNSQEPEMHLNSGDVLPIPPTLQSQPATDINSSSSTDKTGGTTNVGVHQQVQTSNGGLPPSIFGEGTLKKPEDNVKELMAGTNHHLEQAVMDDDDKTENNDYLDEDNDDSEEDEDDESEEDKKMDYKNQHQRPDPGPSSGQEKSNSFMAIAQ